MNYIDPTGNATYGNFNGQVSQQEAQQIVADLSNGYDTTVTGAGSTWHYNAEYGTYSQTMNPTSNGLTTQNNNLYTPPENTPGGAPGNINNFINGNNVNYRSVIDTFSPTYNYEQIGNSLHLTPKDNLYSRFDNGDYLGALYSFFFDNLPGFDGFSYDIDTGKLSTMTLGIVPSYIGGPGPQVSSLIKNIVFKKYILGVCVWL